MGRGIQVAECRAGLDTCGIFDSERHHDRIHDVAGHISERSGAEIIETSPVPGCVGRIVRPHLRGPHKEIPVQGLGHLHSASRFHEPLRPYGTVCPAVDLVNISDYSGPDPFGKLAAIVERVSLVAHLGRDLVFLCQFSQEPGLVNRVGERLLDIYMLAESHRMGGHDGMCVVRSGYDNGVYILAHLVKHDSPVLESFG